MLDLYSRTGKGKLVEEVDGYEVRQINPMVSEFEGQLIPYSYIVVAPDQTTEASGIVLPDQVNLGRPVVAICQTLGLARDSAKAVATIERLGKERLSASAPSASHH